MAYKTFVKAGETYYAGEEELQSGEGDFLQPTMSSRARLICGGTNPGA